MTKEVKGECVVLRKNGGFYHAFDDDAKIINYFFDYKIINDRVGFPISSLNKIINTLEDKNISYLIKNSSEEIIEKKCKRNKYKEYLGKSSKKDSINKRIKKIIDMLDKLEDAKLEDIIELIEDKIYE